MADMVHRSRTVFSDPFKNYSSYVGPSGAYPIVHWACFSHFQAISMDMLKTIIQSSKQDHCQLHSGRIVATFSSTDSDPDRLRIIYVSARRFSFP